MATSRYEQLPLIVEYLQATQPKTVLDIGVGFGKIGLLIREYLEAWMDKTTPDKWDIYIEGIEIYENYHKDSFQQIIYNKIIYCNAMDFKEYPSKDKFDLITCFDMVEHLKEDDSINLINYLRQKSSNVLLSVPTGKGWLRNQYGENKYEAHLSEWNTSDLNKLGFLLLREYKIPDGRVMGVYVSDTSAIIQQKP